MAIKSLKCPSCGANIELNDSQEFGYCSYCGSQIQIGERINVNVNVKHDYRNAPSQNVTHIHNQYIINNPVPQTSRKSRLVALILCIILGVLGIHHFYVGRIGMGILYFFTGGLACIGWIVDIVLILIGNYKDADGLPLTEW